MLANGEISDEKDFQVTMLSQPERKKTVDEKVYKYIVNKNKRLNVIDAADALNLPIDEVEKTVFKLVSEGKLKAAYTER